MSRLFDWEEKDLTRSQRLQLAEQKRLNFKQDLANEAHNRFVERTKNFVQNHEVGPWEKNRVMGYMTARQRDEALQEHELAMLKQQGNDKVRVAHEDRLGKKEQGVDAAEAAGKWGFNTEKARGESALQQTEKEWAARTDIAKQEAEAKKYDSETQWGKTNPDGTRTPGGREAIAGIEGQAKVDAAEAQARAAADLQAQKQALEQQKLEAQKQRDAARLKQNYDRLDQKDRAAVDSAANNLAKEKGISFEEARSQIMASREQTQQKEYPREGATSTLSSGRKVVYRNGQWQYAD